MGPSYGHSQGKKSVEVGLIHTSHDRWGYDPYRRSYYDHSIGKYYNLGTHSYHVKAPRRYHSPRYPRHYRRGSVLHCPSHLPRYSSRRSSFSQRRLSTYGSNRLGSSQHLKRSRSGHELGRSYRRTRPNSYGNKSQGNRPSLHSDSYSRRLSSTPHSSSRPSIRPVSTNYRRSGSTSSGRSPRSTSVISPRTR